MIRAARSGDGRAVRELCSQIWSDDYVPHVFRDWVKDRRGRLWVAVEDKMVVGVAKLTVLPSGEAWLHALRVHPDHRRRGIAGALLEHRLSRARRLGARVARLDTGEDNVAVRRLMRRNGFRRAEVIIFHHATPTKADPPRLTRSSEVDAAWRLARGRIFHEDYVARALTRADIAREVRAHCCFAVGPIGRPRAVAIAERQPGRPRARLRIRLVAGTKSAMRDLLVALRGQARAVGAWRAAIMPPAAVWPAARAAGYSHRANDAMLVFEKRL